MRVDCSRFVGWDAINLLQLCLLGLSASLTCVLGPEEGGVAFVRLIPPPDLPNAPAEDRLGGFVVFVSVGLALCSFLLCFSMFLGDKVDVLTIGLSAFGTAGCAVASGLRINGAALASTGERGGVPREQVVGNYAVGAVLGVACAAFVTELVYRLFAVGRSADCVFHPFVVCQPAGILLTSQMLVALGVLAFYLAGMLSNERIHQSDISGAFLDGNSQDTDIHHKLVLFREVATDTAAFAGALIFLLAYVGMILNDYYRSMTTFSSLFLGALYLSVGVLWLLSAKATSASRDRGQLVENGAVVGFGVVSALAGLHFIVSSLLYFCCCGATGEMSRYDKKSGKDKD